MGAGVTPQDIDALRDWAGAIAQPINEWLIADIARRVAGAGAITDTAEYQIYRAEAMGMAKKDIAAAVAKQMGANRQAIDALFEHVLDKSTNFAQNGVLRQLTAAYANITADVANGTLQELWAPGPDGRLYTVQEVYGTCMDFAFGKVMTGAADYNTAICQATRELARRGIRTLERKNGRSVGIEYATRSYVMNRMAALHAEISQFNYDKLGADGWELSAHTGCAPDHEPYQGLQYTDAAYKALNDSLIRKIGTWNCGHIAHPIVLGVSAPNYSAAQLREMQEENARGVTYGGKHYTLYEAGQERAAVENALRRKKLECLTGEALGDAQKLQAQQIRLGRLQEEYVRFCRATGLQTRSERVAVAGFGRGQAARARWAGRRAKQAEVLRQLNFLGDITKQEREAIEKELSRLPEHIRTIAEMHINGIRMTQDKAGSWYDPRTKEILLSVYRPEGAVIHEYAHGLERALRLYQDPAFLSIRDKGLENISLDDILEDNHSYSEPITYLAAQKLVNHYQGRLYESYGIYDGKRVFLDGMREYFSEGLRAFYFESDLLKQRDPALYTYIEELVK